MIKISPSTITGCKGSYPSARGCSGGGKERKQPPQQSSQKQGASDSVPCSTMERLTAASDPQLAFLFNDKVIWELKARGKSCLIQANSLLQLNVPREGRRRVAAARSARAACWARHSASGRKRQAERRPLPIPREGSSSLAVVLITPLHRSIAPACGKPRSPVPSEQFNMSPQPLLCHCSRGSAEPALSGEDPP